MNTSSKAPSDFPDWLGPMLVKELRQGMKARTFVLSFIGLQIVLMLVTIYYALLYSKNPVGFSGSGLSIIFWILIAAQLLIITPVRALGALANERKANTLELIYMTGLTPWRIAWGKWASLMFQAVLFLLAVLPYAILRYFFGGMNLAEEMISLVVTLLLCAILTAASLAISGLPLAARVIFFCLGGFFGMWIVPMMIFGVMLRGATSGPFPTALSLGYGWLLLLYNVVILIVGAIQVAAATISTPADNSAMRLRILVLLSWLPVPLLFAVHADLDALWGQIGMGCVLAVLVCWQHLSVPAEVMRSHVEPYARAGRAAPIVGSLFLPGWPSAVLFLILAEVLGVFSILALPQVGSTEVKWLESTAILMMAGAALMTPPLLWQIARRRPQWPLFTYTLVLVMSGVLFSFHHALDLGDGTSPGHYVWLASFPPVGLWAMVDGGLNDFGEEWWGASLFAFAVCASGLILFSRPYWKRVSQLSSAIRKPALPAATSLPSAAA